MRTDCPRCDAPVNVRRSEVGASVRCPDCRKMFVVADVREPRRGNSNAMYLVLGIIGVVGFGFITIIGVCVAAIVYLGKPATPNTATGNVALNVPVGQPPIDDQLQPINPRWNPPVEPPLPPVVPVPDPIVPPPVARPPVFPPPVVPPPVRPVRTDPPEPEAVAAPALPKIDPAKRSAPNKSVALAAVAREKGLTVTPLAINGAGLADDLVWAADGGAFFAQSRDGVLRRITYPKFVEDQRLEIGRPVGGVALSKAGVLVAVTDLAEVWVVDPITLEVKTRIPAPGVTRVLSGPDLGFAFAVAAGDRFGGGGVITYLDLDRGKPVHTIRAPTYHARLTPDGKHYFAQAGMEALVGYRVEGDRLKGPPRSTDRIAQNGQRICVSPDGKHVCLPSGGGNYGASYATFIYTADDLAKVATVSSGHYPQAVGFDPVAGKIYAQNYDNALVVFDTAGKKLATHTAAGTGSDVRQFVVHPKGNRLLIVGGNRVFFAELAADK